MKRRIPKELFKTNYHLAEKCNLKDIEEEIKNYPKKFTPPKYLTFIRSMLLNGWGVKIYKPDTASKYIYILKPGSPMYKIRFSNHRPNTNRELNKDCDYYVGISNLQTLTTEQLLQELLKK